MRTVTVCLILVLLAGMAAAEEKKPQRCSLETAAQRVTAAIRREKPKAVIDGPLPVVDLTTDAVWDQLHVQVVKVHKGQIALCESFVLRGDEVWKIGRGFGGTGVTSLAAADLAADKHPLLIFACNWGSGVYRSEIGVVDFHEGSLKESFLTPVNLSGSDFSLRQTKQGNVEVLVGGAVIGEVTAQRKNKELTAQLKLADNLPEEVRRSLR
jgi:hypothetical protein